MVIKSSEFYFPSTILKLKFFSAIASNKAHYKAKHLLE